MYSVIDIIKALSLLIEANFPASEHRDNILRFIRGSKRGIISKPRARK